MRSFNIIVMLIILFTILTMSIGYSALNTNLTISGTALATQKQSVRIISNEAKTTEGAYDTYSPTFTDTTITTHTTIEYGTSKMEYTVGIQNTTSKIHFIEKINVLIDDNELIIYSIKGISNYQEIQPGETIYFTITLMLDRVWTVQSETLSLEFKFSESYIFEDDVLNGADPELVFGMVPIVYEKNGTIKKADINSNWYSYLDKQWANAVLVTEESRAAYDEAKAGTKIEEVDILAYYVWIPRFEYKIFNNTLSLVDKTEVDIRFVSKDTTTLNSTTLNTYTTHPAFNYENQSLSGIWVGKFETTGTVTNPTILPNETPLKTTINQLFNANIVFSGGSNDSDGEVFYENNIYYGLTAASESRMIKESEWGAIALLTSSIYGSSDVWNNSSPITGCGGDNKDDSNNSSCINGFNTNNTGEYNQSTTGNAYGIFDLAGASWEFTMGTYENTIAYSGFTSEWLANNSKFFTNISSNYLDNLGYAHTATKSWDNDLYVPTTSAIPWAIRGNSYLSASETGIYAVGNTRGNAANNASRNIIINAPILD